MLTYSFSDKGSDSLYTHLYNCIKNDILSGNLVAGYKLPSKRTFAKNLGISTITVENAYARLISEGYVYSIEKKGYFVAEVNRNRELTRPTPLKHKDSGYKYDLVSNSTIHTLFPFSVWAKLMREVISRKNRELMTKPPCSGTYELRLAIAEHLYGFRGMRVNPEQIVVGAGTEYLYGLIIQLMDKNSIYAIEEPGYKNIAHIYKSHGVRLCHIPIDNKGLRADALDDSNADIIHISPSHHFPTGTVMPIGRRYELLGWASQKDGRYIIEDDYDSEFRLSGQPIPSLSSIDVTDRVIYINTFTKSLASTIRISYMILPPPLAERFYKELGFYSCTVSNFEQYTLREFICGGHFENHINRMRKHYKNVRDALIGAIRANSTLKNSQISEADAGLHFILRLETSMTDEELKAAIKRRGINVSCLSDYYENKENADSGAIIINYSNILEEDVKDLTSKIAAAVSSKA